MAKNNASTTSEEAVLVVLIISLGILYYLWNEHFRYVAEVWRWVRLGELYAFYPVTLTGLFSDLEVGQAIEFLKRTPGHLIHSSTIQAFDSRYPKVINIIPGLLILAYGIYRVNSTERIDQVFDEETLLQRYANTYPWLRPFVSVNPVKIPALFVRGRKERTEHGYGLAPHEFAELSPPLLLESLAKKNSAYRKPIYSEDDGFDLDLAERAFTAQLRRPFISLDKMSNTEKEVYQTLWPRVPIDVEYCREQVRYIIKAIMLGKQPDIANPMAAKLKGYCLSLIRASIVRHKKSIKGLKGDIKTDDGLLSAIGSLDKDERMKVAKSLLKPDAMAAAVEQAEGQGKSILQEVSACHALASHGYVLTGLLRLLVEARRSGVLDSFTHFRHIKGQDRTLWYVLNSCGRQTPYVEAAGVLAHYYQELEIGRAIPRPIVLEAVDQLKKAVMVTDPDALGMSKRAHQGRAPGTTSGVKL